jgi:type II secretory pathway pseudopilin PulG
MTTPSRCPYNSRTTTGGFTLIEAVVVLSILVMGLLAMTSTSVTVNALREADRERRLASSALDSIIEDIKRTAATQVGSDPSWSENFIKAYSPGGNPGPEYPVHGLEPQDGEASIVTITVTRDETLTDAEIGANLGMPRDLDNDGLVSNTDVNGTATILPVIVRLRWAGASGNRELVQSFFVLGY